MTNLFDNFFNKISEIFSLKSSGQNGASVLGIDIGASSIKIVQLANKKGSAVLQTYGEISLGPYAKTQIGRATKLSAEKLAEALVDVLKESGSSTKNSSMSIPIRFSMVSVFKMPEMPRKQLEKMVPVEARKYIPVPISEVTLDWFVIPNLDERKEDGSLKNKKKGGSVEIMMVAIHNDILANYSNVVSAAQLDTSFFEIEMFSTARAVLDSGFLMPVMIVDVGAGATKVYITERGVIRDSHTIGRGSQDLTLNLAKNLGIDIEFAEKLKRNYGQNEINQDQSIAENVDSVFNPIFATANEVLLKFEKRYNKNVSRVIMVGGGSLLTGLADKAQKYFGIETVSGNPFEKVQTPAFLEPVLAKTGVMFAGAIGLALRKLQELE